MIALFSVLAPLFTKKFLGYLYRPVTVFVGISKKRPAFGTPLNQMKTILLHDN